MLYASCMVLRRTRDLRKKWRLGRRLGRLRLIRRRGVAGPMHGELPRRSSDERAVLVFDGFLGAGATARVWRATWAGVAVAVKIIEVDEVFEVRCQRHLLRHCMAAPELRADGPGAGPMLGGVRERV